MTELETLVAALATSEGGAVLATLVRVDGSAYRGPGARLLIRTDGSTVGAISGGCLEKDAIARAEEVRATGRARLVTWDLTRDDDKPWGLGTGCNAVLDVLLEPCSAGAEVAAGVHVWLATLCEAEARRATVVLSTVFATGTHGGVLGERRIRAAANGEHTHAQDGVLHEVLTPPIALVACGDGPDTAPLLSLAASLGWQTRAVRKDDALGELDARTAAIVMTHNYQRDLDLVGELLPSAAGYVGLLGPRARTERLLADLRSRGDLSTVQSGPRLHAPVGLDIGAETPHEIALAIAAEVRAAFSNRPGGPLQDRVGPIHDRAP